MGDVRRKIKRSLLGLFLLVVVMNGLILADGFGGNARIELKSFFLNHVFDYYGIMKKKALALAMENLVFVVYFNLVFGNYIYVYFTQGSSFVFSRIYDKGRWLREKTICLSGICALFGFVYLALQLGVCMYSSKQIPDAACLKIFLQFWLAFSFLLMLSTYSINFLAVRGGMVKAFFCVYITMLALMKASLSYGSMAVLKRHYFLHLLNPMSASSLAILEGKSIKAMAVFYYFFLLVGMAFFFEKYIRRMDILKNSISDL